MPRRSKITQWPKAIKAWFDQLLIERNFSGYERLTDEANAELEKLGCDLRIGKSAAHRYGSNLERRIAAIKASTEAAAMLAQAAPDDADDRSAAVVSMTQTGLLNILIDLEEASSAEDKMQRAKLLSTVAKNVATLTNSSVHLKRFQAEYRSKVKSAADAAAKIGRKGGLSKAGVEEIRREILGIAQQPRE